MKDIMNLKYWERIFQDKLNFPLAICSEYAKCFASKDDLDLFCLSEMSRTDLKQMGIKSLGHQLAILQYAKEYCDWMEWMPEAKLPIKLTLKMNQRQWEKFMNDWRVYLSLTPPKRLQRKTWRLLDCCENDILLELRRNNVNITDYSELLEKIHMIVRGSNIMHLHKMSGDKATEKNVLDKRGKAVLAEREIWTVLQHVQTEGV